MPRCCTFVPLPRQYTIESENNKAYLRSRMQVAKYQRRASRSKSLPYLEEVNGIGYAKVKKDLRHQISG
jgi:hypothetical protein